MLMSISIKHKSQASSVKAFNMDMPSRSGGQANPRGKASHKNLRRPPASGRTLTPSNLRASVRASGRAGGRAGMSTHSTPSPPTKSSGFGGFDSSRLLILRGGNSYVRMIL